MRHFVAAQHAFRLHDLKTAREQLEQVQKIAPQHVGARNGMAKIRQHEVEVEYAQAAWELANSAKKLVEAKRAVEAWRKLVDPTLPEVREAWKEVTAGLREAEELAARARRLERADPPAARVLYRQSLEIAVDLPDALAGLNRCPPDSADRAGALGAGRPDSPVVDRSCARWPGPFDLRDRSQTRRPA